MFGFYDYGKGCLMAKQSANNDLNRAHADTGIDFFRWTVLKVGKIRTQHCLASVLVPLSGTDVTISEF